MTTGTMVGYWQPRRLNLFPILLSVILLAVIAYTGHAVVKHGNDATRIRQCIENNGPNQVWKSMSYRTPNKYYLVCEIEPDLYGLSVIEQTKRGLREKTSYIVKNGRSHEVREYLTARAHQLESNVWSLLSH